MTKQFNRKVIVQVGERNGERLLITNLRMNFQVEKNDKADPNRATLSIYNLSPKSRAKLEEITDLFLTIEAGYGDTTKIIFSGDVDKIESKKSTINWVTTIECGDGKKDLKETEFDKSYKKGTKVTTIVQDVLNAFPNLKNKGLAQGLIDQGKELLTGGSFSGSAKEIVQKLLGSQDLDFSVQNGEVVITEEFQPTNNEVFIVTPSSGLINSPSNTEEKTKDGKIRKGVNFTALLNPAFNPKQLVKVKGQYDGINFLINGDYVISKVTHVGDNQQGTFYSQVSALER